MAGKKNYIVGVFEDDDHLFSVIRQLQENKIKIAEVYTPFPVHGLEHALHLKESRIPLAGFFGGALGLLGALAMQIGMLGIDWPVNIGGKPRITFPTYIPITFELTVLLASLTMVGVYLYANKLFPGIFKDLAHERQTDDVFVVLVEEGNEEFNNKVKEIFSSNHAIETEIKALKI